MTATGCCVVVLLLPRLYPPVWLVVVDVGTAVSVGTGVEVATGVSMASGVAVAAGVADAGVVAVAWAFVFAAFVAARAAFAALLSAFFVEGAPVVD